MADDINIEKPDIKLDDIKQNGEKVSNPEILRYFSCIFYILNLLWFNILHMTNTFFGDV